jgi:hypothetical protein
LLAVARIIGLLTIGGHIANSVLVGVGSPLSVVGLVLSRRHVVGPQRRGLAVGGRLTVLVGVGGSTVGPHGPGGWHHASHHSALELNRYKLSVLVDEKLVVPASEEGDDDEHDESEDEDFADPGPGLLVDLLLLLG